MRISDWSSDVCSSDLFLQRRAHIVAKEGEAGFGTELVADLSVDAREGRIGRRVGEIAVEEGGLEALFLHRSDEHTSELDSLMRNFCADVFLKEDSLHVIARIGDRIRLHSRTNPHVSG